MAKFFKVIVNIIIIVCVLSVVALIVPPLVGVEENIAGPQMDTNLSEGTVVYGTKLPVAMTSAGDEIVYSGDGYLYLYRVNEIDADNGEVHVSNEVSGEQSVLQISKSVTKKVLAVPFIGYIMIATETKEGLAMLISAAVVLILLALVAELSVKKAYPEEEEEEEEEEYFSEIARDMENEKEYEAEYNAGELLAGEVAAAAAENIEKEKISESAPMAKEELLSEKEAVQTADAAEQSPAESLIADLAEQTEEEAAWDEDEEEIPEAEKAEDKTIVIPAKLEEVPAEEITEKAAEASARAAAEEKDKKAAADAAPAKKEEKTAEEAVVKASAAVEQKADRAAFDIREMDDAFDNVPEDRSAASLNISDEEIPDVSNALVAALASTQVSRSERIYQQQAQTVEETPVDPADEIELAIPVLSAEEILDAAYAAGDDPGVTRDEVTGVTLVDFSDCLG